MRKRVVWDSHFVYTIEDEGGEIFYVGQTNDLFRRLQQHIYESVRGTSRKDERIRQIRAAGQVPLIRNIWEANGQREADSREEYYIGYYYAALGSKLCNDVAPLGAEHQRGRFDYAESHGWEVAR